MESNEEVLGLLRDIRDTQREQLSVYQDTAERSIALQEANTARYEQAQRLYRRMVLLVLGLVSLFLALQFLGALSS